MSLEDCLADVADMGATDIEILADTHVAGYPSPSSEWVDRWLTLVDRAGLRPTCYSSWLDTRLHRDRALSLDEAVAILRRDLELAHRLGFSIVRPKLGVVSLDLIPDPIWRDTVERVLPDAAELGIAIAPEIHSPTPLRSRIVDDYVDLVRETGTEHFGLLIDTGIFQTEERKGGHGDSVYVFGDPEPELRERVAREMSKPLAVDPADLVDLMPYVVHVHAKFWDMTDDLTDPHIPYDGIVRALVEGGFTGSVSSEYEGPREPLPRVRRAPPTAADAPPLARRGLTCPAGLGRASWLDERGRYRPVQATPWRRALHEPLGWAASVRSRPTPRVSRPRWAGPTPVARSGRCSRSGTARGSPDARARPPRTAPAGTTSVTTFPGHSPDESTAAIVSSATCRCSSSA